VHFDDGYPAHGGSCWFAVTQHPTAEWLARQITVAFPWDKTPTYIVSDNDRPFGSVFTRRIRAMGIRDRPTSFRSPWQNGHVERLIGSIRRECTDHLIVLNEEHLRRILAKFSTYCNGWSPHVSLRKDAPDRRPIERFGGHRRTCNLGRVASPVRANLVFRSDTSIRRPFHTVITQFPA
jgi:transposase InsO family protein